MTHDNKKCLGIDGCAGGWICAGLNGGGPEIERFSHIGQILEAHCAFDICLIDIPIGLQSGNGQKRPDKNARGLIPRRASTIFPAPCRQAVYARSIAEAYRINEEILGKKFTPLTAGLIPKIREVDEFLQRNPEYKNRLMESHPETCFRQLCGRTLTTKKKSPEGIAERLALLSQLGIALDADAVKKLSRDYKCAVDDIVDAVCLAVSAVHTSRGEYITLPESPEADATGLLMRMVLPKAHF